MADGTVVIDSRLDNTGLKTDLKGIEGVIGGGLAAAGLSLAAITAGAMALGTQVYKVGTEFEQSFAKVNTMLGGTSVNTRDLQGNILNLSDATGVAAAGLNDGLYQALSAGVSITGDGSDALAFMTTQLKLARGGFTDVTTAVDTTTTVVNAYGKSQSEAAAIADILITTQNEGKTTVAELGSALGQVIPLAASVDLEFEQVAATMATLTAQGNGTAESATKLKSMLSELSKSGTTASDAFKDAAGVAFPQFIAAGGTLTDGLALMNQNAANSGLLISDLFGSVEAAGAALNLVSDTGAAKFNQSLDKMHNSAGATDAAFDVMSNTLGFKMDQAFNKFKNAGIRTFDALAPVIETGAQGLNLLADVVGAIPQPVLKIGLAFTAAFVTTKAVNVLVGVASGFKNTATAIFGHVKAADKDTVAATKSATAAAAKTVALKAGERATRAATAAAEKKIVVDSKGNTLLSVSTIATGALAATEKAHATAKGAQAVATTAATTAQKGLNVAMAANVVGVVVLAITSLITILGGWQEKQKQLKESAWKDFSATLKGHTADIYKQRDAIIAANTDTRSWAERLAELKGVDINTPINVELQGAYGELDDLKGVFFEIAKGGDGAQDAIGRLCEAVDTWVEKQKEVRNQQFSAELWDLAAAFNSGALTAEDYVTACEGVTERSDAYNGSMDETAQKLKEIQEGTAGGAEGYLALAASMGLASTTSADLTEYQLTSAQAAQDLQDALARGDGTESLKLKTDALNEALLLEASIVQGDVGAAYQNYAASIDAANQSLEAGIGKSREEMTVTAEKGVAYGQLAEIYFQHATGMIDKSTMLHRIESEGLTAINGEYVTSAEQRGVAAEGMYGDLCAQATGFGVQSKAIEENLSADLAALAADRTGTLTAEDRTAAMERGGVFAQYAGDLLSAEQKLGTDISASTSGWSAEQLAQLSAWATNSKVPVDRMSIDTIDALVKMTGKASETLKDGGTDSVEKYTEELNKVLPKLDELTAAVVEKQTQTGEGANEGFRSGLESNRSAPIDAAGQIGTDIAGAAARGVTSGTAEVVNACISMARQAIEATRNELGQKSPTGIFRDDIGKNVALAFGYGASENMDSAFDEIQKSIGVGSAKLSHNLEVTHAVKSSILQPTVNVAPNIAGSAEQSALLSEQLKALQDIRDKSGSVYFNTAKVGTVLKKWECDQGARVSKGEYAYEY